MKKLIVVLAAVALAAMSQAASVSWTVSNIYKGNTTDKALTTDGYMVYLVNDATYSRTDALSALEAGTLDVSGKATVSSGLTADGKVNKTVDLGALADGSYTFYNVIVGDGNALISGTVTATITSVGDSQIQSFNAKTLSQNSANWKPAGGGSGDIPEPTSGLLLLVGAGMLALRRKQK